MRHFITTLAFLVLATDIAGAQFPDRIRTGVRVRLWLPDYQQENTPWRRQLLRATVSGIANDTLQLTVRGAQGILAVPRSAIRRIDVSLGPPSRPASAFERAAQGAITGALWAAFENDPRSTEWPHYNRTWRAAGEGAKWGAAFGAVIGFVFPTERWRRVRLKSGAP